MYEGITGRFIDPSAVATHFHLREGDVVADFGAGSGHFMKPLSEAVGQTGRVYLCEIQKPLVEALGVQARVMRHVNIQVLWSDIEVMGGTKIPDGTLDAGVLSNVLFQIEDKETMFKEMARTMRRGAKLFIIDWTGSFSGLGPQPDAVISAQDAQMIAERNGFAYDRSFPTGDHHYGLALRRQ